MFRARQRDSPLVYRAALIKKFVRVISAPANIAGDVNRPNPVEAARRAPGELRELAEPADRRYPCGVVSE